MAESTAAPFLVLALPHSASNALADGLARQQGLIIDIALQGNVVFVRFYEAEGSGMDRRTPPPADKYKKLKASADACVDIPTIMASLPVAIKNAAKQSRSDV